MGRVGAVGLEGKGIIENLIGDIGEEMERPDIEIRIALLA